MSTRLFPTTDLPQSCFDADVELIDRQLIDGLDRYFNHRIPTGDFLAAVLRNDLCEACLRGSTQSLLTIPRLIHVLNHYAPRNAWGSPQAVDAWLKERAKP